MKFCFLLLTTILLASAAPEVEITSEPHHHQTLANEQVRVFQVEIRRDSPTVTHWHRHDYFYVSLGAAHISNEVAGKPPVDLELQNGETRFSQAPFAHVIRDLSSEPFRNVTVELLEDARLRKLSSPWKEERGLDILEGGTEDITMVKDGVRVSQIELQAGGIVPQTTRAKAALLIGLTDVNLREAGNAGHNTVIQVKAGESRWLRAGLAHAVRSEANHNSKFILLEFP